MEIFLQVCILVIGIALLVSGASWLVSGASSVASHFKISKQLVGLTVITVGTGAPELAIAFSSIASGNTDMLVGNVIGSNIVNILLLVGIAAIIKPIPINKNTISKELPLLLLISTILAILFFTPGFSGNTGFSRNDAIVCVLLFAIFIYYLIRMARSNRERKIKSDKPKYKLKKSILLVIVGLAGTIIGSELVVNSASAVAAAIGISERIISLSIIAIGTSLPELVTTIIAARRGEHDLLVGNIIGSNIFNICIVLGLPVAIFGAIIPQDFEVLDMAILVGSTFVLWLVTLFDHKITRAEGSLMIAIFAIYYSYLIYGALT